MKRFDTQAVHDRIVDRLKFSKYWNFIQERGPLDELLYAFSESMNEQSRYLEYLYRETKWDTAQNYSSVEKLATLVGKKKNRKKSNVVAMIISPYKNIFDLGVRFSDLGKIGSDRSSLVGQTVLKKGSYFKFEGKCYNLVSDIVYNHNEKYMFGYFIEGTRKEVILGKSNGLANQAFTINTDSIEANALSFTKDFNYIVAYDGKSEVTGTTYYEETANNLSKNIFSINTKDGMSTISFSDGIIGNIPAKDQVLKFYYLDTSGSSGNFETRYKMDDKVYLLASNGQPITFTPEEEDLDALTEVEREMLYNDTDQVFYVQNDAVFMNGNEFEDFDEFKANATATARARPDKIFAESDLDTFIRNSPESEISKISILDTRYNDFTILYSALNYKYDKFEKDDADQISRYLNSVSEQLIVSSPYFIYKDPRIIKLAVKIDLESEESETKMNELKEKIKYSIMQQYSCLAMGFNKAINVSDIFNIIKENTQDIALSNIDITFFEKMDLEASAGGSYLATVISRDSVLKSVFFKVLDDTYYIPYDFNTVERKAFSIPREDMFSKSPNILSNKKIEEEDKIGKIVKYVEYTNFFILLENITDMSERKAYFVYIDEVII